MTRSGGQVVAGSCSSQAARYSFRLSRLQHEVNYTSSAVHDDARSSGSHNTMSCEMHRLELKAELLCFLTLSEIVAFHTGGAW